MYCLKFSLLILRTNRLVIFTIGQAVPLQTTKIDGVNDDVAWCYIM